eukprot:CAMPEP_0181381212 /NCGR_PEP_ID=MMETSP1106-20121128/19994_1 /TAXON_ID=81844 /ORGANISM="Mantoniella antarctica, Strain SL-175" /LENGTH=171 /DNA_ID=CAMNT_0023500367 /DNA_START=69 /DNA_END=580 /DNA_ORIENTATION=-
MPSGAGRSYFLVSFTSRVVASNVPRRVNQSTFWPGMSAESSKKPAPKALTAVTPDGSRASDHRIGLVGIVKSRARSSGDGHDSPSHMPAIGGSTSVLLAALALVDELPAVEIPPLPIPPLVRYKVGRRGAGLNPRRVEESTGLRAEEGERAAEEAEERAREVAEGATTRNG